MNVFIVNAYNRHNGGDAALLSVLIDQVRQAFPNACISFSSLENPEVHPEFEGARNVGSLRRWAGDESVPRYRRIGRKVAASGLSLTPRPALLWLGGGGIGRVEPVNEIAGIAQADLVIGLGGGYLSGSTSVAGTLSVFFLLLPLMLASRLRRPTILAPQSYGPFGRGTQVRLVRSCLNRVDRIVVREDVSLGLLRSLGVNEHLLERGVDSAFALGKKARIAQGLEQIPEHPRVGVTARAWMTGSDQESYERSLATFIDWLVGSRGASVTLVPQVTCDYQEDDDRLVSRRVSSYCSSSPEVIDTRLDHVKLRAVYGDLDYVVGTRFHSVIFGLTNGIPCLAIEYEHKTSGIMEDLGLAAWVIPMQEVTAARLRDRFVALERARSDYKRQLQERLPDYVRRAQDFVDVLRGSVR